jgi:hypothetical protein
LKRKEKCQNSGGDKPRHAAIDQGNCAHLASPL